MEDPIQSSIGGRCSGRGKRKRTPRSPEKKEKPRKRGNRVQGAFVFFDVNMKKRFVDVFGNVRGGGSGFGVNMDSGPVNHEFVLVGTKKYVVQVVEWNTETVSRRKLIRIGARFERRYPRCDFVAWVLSDESKQTGITPLAVGTKNGGIMARDVTGPAGLLESLEWTVDDDFNLILASKVFQSVHSRHTTPTDQDIIQEMSQNLQSRSRPGRASGAILSRGRNSESSFLGQRRRVNRDMDLAYSLMQAESQAFAPPPRPPRRDLLPALPFTITPSLSNSTYLDDEITSRGRTNVPQPRAVQQFFNMLPGGGGGSLADVLLLSMNNIVSVSSRNTRSSSRRTFEGVRKEAAKAKKDEKISDVSEADLEAFIAMKKQEKVEVKASQPKARSAEDETCIICFDSAINTVFVPCGHSNCCSQCADTTKHVNKKCPICRETIISVMRLHKK